MKHIFGKILNKNELWGEFSICKDLSKQFDKNKLGLKGFAKYDNLLPLVQFAREQEKRYGEPLYSKETGYLQNKLEGVGQELRTIRKEGDRSEDDEATKLSKELKNEDDISDTLLRIYDYLLKNWDLVYSLQVTYSVLSELTDIRGNWKSNSRDKRAYYKILRFVEDEQKNMDIIRK